MKTYKSGFTSSNRTRNLRAVLVGAFAGAVLCIILLLITSLVFAKAGNLPQGAANLIVLILVSISALAGGYITVRMLKKNGLLFGLLSGFALFLLVLISGVITFGESFSLAALTKAAIMCTAGAIGGIISINKKEKHRF